MRYGRGSERRCRDIERELLRGIYRQFRADPCRPEEAVDVVQLSSGTRKQLRRRVHTRSAIKQKTATCRIPSSAILERSLL